MSKYMTNTAEHTLRAILPSIVMLFLATLSSCSSTRSTTSNHIDELFREYDQPNGPGAVVSIIKDGSVVIRSYGLASLEERHPVTASTNFRLASITKQFTAAAILKLVEQEKLSLDDKILKFFPDLQARTHAITVHHLLTHTSGILDYEPIIPDSQTVQVLDKDVLSMLQQADSTYFLPGSTFRYSNSGYALLALIVEAVSGQPFTQFLRENIFLPIGMENTVAREETTVIAERAYGYTRTDAGFALADQSVTSAVLGDGGIYSSVGDLYKWDQALYTNTVLSESMLEKAFTPHVTTDRMPYDYGYGWFMGIRNGVRVFFHLGSSRGFRNAIIRVPDRQLTVIILTNRNEGEPVEKGWKIVDWYVGEGKRLLPQ
jgi:CubicO group peptidase (beta-lactamase class C family)